MNESSMLSSAMFVKLRKAAMVVCTHRTADLPRRVNAGSVHSQERGCTAQGLV